MRPDVFQVIGYGSLVLLGVYAAFYIWRLRTMPKTKTSSADVGDAHIAALKENSELLRELIAINRQLLDTKEKPEA